MLKVFGIKNCNSMKKTFDLLNELQLPYEFHDYKKLSIDTSTVETWINTLGSEVILNKKGTTWRKLSAEEQAKAMASHAQLVAALTTHTSMIKRPIIQTQNGYVVGFDENKIRALK